MNQEKIMQFELSAEETQAYKDWVSGLAAEGAASDEAGLDAVCISFVMTPMGTGVVAHLNNGWDENSPHIILRDMF